MQAPLKAPRRFRPQDLEAAILFHRTRVRRIQLWRRANSGRPGIWIHLGRYRPYHDLLLRIRSHFGGGHYRAKLLGPWLHNARREGFIQQVTFTLSGPPTEVTRQRLAKRGLRAAVP
jgi:hypothetical protein